MQKDILNNIVKEIGKLNPSEKGYLMSLILINEKSCMKGDRKKFFGALSSYDSLITDKEIEEVSYNPDLDKLIE
ncbi:MAG: hypothetical protein A3I68_06295 [Candidatus Melainabacteria bacterium RIFCSPLOWO2_02_FULL_35_15]|nr:MAG: hypothetical protein A3I68_06295 [Candidatus Melainabacteria bacterium RIFCSPLOWO2_02_FULL_35_15]